MAQPSLDKVEPEPVRTAQVVDLVERIECSGCRQCPLGKQRRPNHLRDFANACNALNEDCRGRRHGTTHHKDDYYDKGRVLMVCSLAVCRGYCHETGLGLVQSIPHSHLIKHPFVR